MSEAKGSHGKLTRRGFLKVSGAAAGALGLAGAAGMVTADDWLAPAKAHAESEEHVAYTYHHEACMGNCSLACTVRDGRISLIQPNDALDPYYAQCCLKGLSEVQHVYGIERLQTPLKRVGERGSGEFESITWDEAMKTVGEKLSEVRSKYGNASVHVACSGAPEYPLLVDVLGASTSGLGDGLDIGVGNGFDPALGDITAGAATNEIRDWKNSKLLIITSSNPLESSMMQATAFFDAKEAGCEIVVVDPHYSTTASKAHRWIPIKPGTDAALFLGMVSRILDEKLYDEGFLKANTTMPFLVSVEDGTVLRDHDEIISEAGEPETGEENPYMVWDGATQSVKSYLDEGVEPVLEGSFTVDGVVYEPVFQQLFANQKQHTVSWAAEKTGIDEATIESLADQYATGGPASLAVGYGGSDKYSNADITGHALALLGALTGNVGSTGRGMGNYLGGSGYGAELAMWPLPEDMIAAPSEMPSYRFRTEPNNTHAVISIGNTFQTYFANMNLTREWLDTVDFILGIEIFNSDSVQYADIVLPACTKFECDEEIGGVKCAYNHLRLREKVIDPLFESKTDFQIQYEIAKSLGLEGALPKTAEDYVRFQIEESEDETLRGVKLSDLVSNQGVLPLPGIEEPRIGYADQQYSTPSGKLDLYYSDLVDFGQALPTWEENLELFDGNSRMDTYPLQFVQARTRFHIHSQFCDATWIQQHYTPYLELNPADMETRSLTDGDAVTVFNDRGSFSCPVRVNASVRPGIARIYEGMWSKYMDGGNIQDVTNDTTIERGDMLVFGPVIPFNDTLVEVKKA
ncbi:molybdopterin-dependent oxidoreductase [Raoultibacter massiliensis]|uniref:Molybdopterin-dependent oxidoreductase n=1 Tax=Raoultibacter massiliensis TaxID=1852371 RepID=A0ABV1JAD4_9ACTN|nr:molybdopterin-dependent oxidoreductase [Raoultibacter massiliensis]